MPGRFLAALAAVFVLVLSPVARGEGPAAPFLGLWDGASTSVEGPLRAASLLVEEEADGTLALSWRNYEATGITIEERAMEVRLVPDGAGGYAGQVEEGGAQAIGLLEGGVLTVTLLATTEDGAQERQVYRREVAGDHLVLHYFRFVGDELRSQLTAEYVRTLQ